MKKGRYSALRKGRTSQGGHYYHLTFSTLDRLPVFHDLYRARYLITQMHENAIQERVETLSYVLMPDHVH